MAVLATLDSGSRAAARGWSDLTIRNLFIIPTLAFLIIFNIASAVAIYPVLKRRFPVLSLAFVSARLMESMFIGMGIIAVLALGTLRLHAGDGDPAALTVVGQALVAVHDWTFKMGPGVVVGFGNGIILGYMMWKTRLLPRFLSILGLVGGPALLAGSAGVMLGYFDFGSTIHSLSVAPEFLWELLLGIWLLVRVGAQRTRCPVGVMAGERRHHD